MHYTSQGQLEGLRQGDWKLLVKKPRVRRNQKNKQKAGKKQEQVLLFQLGEDLGEKNNLAETHPEKVAQLRRRMEELDAEITTNSRAPWFKTD